jgi:hypothetical protein
MTFLERNAQSNDCSYGQNNPTTRDPDAAHIEIHTGQQEGDNNDREENATVDTKDCRQGKHKSDTRTPIRELLSGA